MKKVKLAIVGVGNCASALVQGLRYYRDRPAVAGVMHSSIGGYAISDIQVVAAFDIDRRKVGRPLEEAVFAPPNCTTVFQRELDPTGVTVQMGPVLDGVPAHMARYPEAESFRISTAQPVDVVDVLKRSGAEVLACYLPVGSDRAVAHYAEACLEARVALVNCMPSFIASHVEWAERFRARGLPAVGDDIKSQVGATIVHRALARLMGDRGAHLERTYQLNTGGNTDFLNMLESDRLKSKRISKTESVQSQLDVPLAPGNIHIGPSDYVPWQKDHKVCFLRIEWLGFGGVANDLELRMAVEDSPNSAGVAVDAIRIAKLALDRGFAGPVEGPSAYLMKHPIKQMREDVARAETERFIRGG
ncbi:MAG: inositol-3-phosphate synthase [Deltaproteobacteria bacterium]|nr:inositol-3-phosphate synthase [Deltaproteobacteria bacterium]